MCALQKEGPSLPLCSYAPSVLCVHISNNTSNKNQVHSERWITWIMKNNIKYFMQNSLCTSNINKKKLKKKKKSLKMLRLRDSHRYRKNTILWDDDILLYINGCKYQSYESILWGWVRFKVYSVIWYQSHFESILTSVCWAYQTTCYRTVIEPLSNHPSYVIPRTNCHSQNILKLFSYLFYKTLEWVIIYSKSLEKLVNNIYGIIWRSYYKKYLYYIRSDRWLNLKKLSKTKLNL